MKITLQTSIESDLAEKVNEAASEEKRSISNMIAIMIEEAIKRRNGKSKK